jgi:hypothetical protein
MTIMEKLAILGWHIKQQYLLNNTNATDVSMINILTNLMADSDYSDSIDESLPILKKLQLVDEEFVPNEDDNYSENLQEIVGKVQERDHAEIFVFDSECIADRTDYADLTQALFANAGMPSAIQKIKSDYSANEEKAGLALRIGDATFRKFWDQTSDYVADAYLAFIDEVLEQSFEKKLLVLPTGDQCCRLLVVAKADYEPLKEFFTLAEKGVNADTIYTYRFWVTIFITLVGFIITPFIGWYFFGFWTSVLYSLVLWLIFGGYNLFRAASIVVEEERAEKLKTEDPLLYAQSIMTAFVEEAAAREKNSPMGKRLKAVAEIRKKELEEKLAAKIKDPA